MNGEITDKTESSADSCIAENIIKNNDILDCDSKEPEGGKETNGHNSDLGNCNSTNDFDPDNKEPENTEPDNPDTEMPDKPDTEKPNKPDTEKPDKPDISGGDSEPSIKSLNLNCDEKVPESDVEKVVDNDDDPLAVQNNDLIKHTDDSTSKQGSCSPQNKIDDDTVSVNSESDADELLCLGETTPNSDIILIDGEQNGDAEVHEILSDDDNDDCVVTSDDKNSKDIATSLAASRNRRPLTKNKVYFDSGDDYDDLDDDEESDLEVIPIQDPLINSNRKKTKKKQTPQKRSNVSAMKRNKKTPAILFVDPIKIVSKNNKKKFNPVKNHSVDIKKVVACGTTITPVSSKEKLLVPSEKPLTPEPPEPILPSLTDDMFVVEAPSFIVPYVYEKPAEVPFKEFVTKLGIELEEQQVKAEEVRKQKEQEEKEKREKEIQERRERGEDVSDLLVCEKEKIENEEKQKKKLLRQERRRKRRGGEEDDPAWEAENDESSSEDLSDDDLKDSHMDVDEVVATPSKEPAKIDSYFNTTLGKFFMDIGMNLVQEHVQRGLLVQESRKLSREKRSGYNTNATQSSIIALTSNIEKSKENNALFTFPLKKCDLCTFKTESKIVMANHLEVPHMRNNMFVCNNCSREVKGCHDILVHMLMEHQIKGRLERGVTLSTQQCATCPYDDTNKTRMARHIATCQSRFRPDTNLAITEWEPPAKIPKLVKPRPPLPMNNMNYNARSPYNMAFQQGINAPQGIHSFRPRATPVPMRMQARPLILTKKKENKDTPVPVAQKPLLAPNIMQKNRSGAEVEKVPATLAISPLPRHNTTDGKSDESFVMCEICDGYIKDLDQLRNHMLWIHKIKIHPKMIYNRPPLNCQKCQFRFFTDQGLERHLLGAHGLVTNSMQEAANKRKDCGRCPICGRVYQYKLLGHVSRDHNMTLKPAHLSYKCTVCTATFDTYKEFEGHVYSAHRVVAKRLNDKAKAGTAKPGDATGPTKTT